MDQVPAWCPALGKEGMPRGAEGTEVGVQAGRGEKIPPQEGPPARDGGQQRCLKGSGATR